MPSQKMSKQEHLALKERLLSYKERIHIQDYRIFGPYELAFFKKILEQCLINKKLFELDQRVGIYVFNFGEGIEYSLHVECFLRIRKGNEIILTSSDPYYAPNWAPLSTAIYKKEQKHPKGRSLISSSIQNVLFMTQSAYVEVIDLNELGDLLIQFNNGVKIEILVDRMAQNEEFYRFFKYETDNCNDPHYIIKFLEGKIILESSGARIPHYEDS